MDINKNSEEVKKDNVYSIDSENMNKSKETREINDETPKRRISLTLNGDDAISFSLLETILLPNDSKSKSERESVITHLALISLEKVINDLKVKTGKKYPTVSDIQDFLR